MGTIKIIEFGLAQLTYRESLRDIETCLLANQTKLHGMGFRSSVKRSTLADANEGRDWQQHLNIAPPQPESRRQYALKPAHRPMRASSCRNQNTYTVFADALEIL